MQRARFETHDSRVKTRLISMDFFLYRSPVQSREGWPCSIVCTILIEIRITFELRGRINAVPIPLLRHALSLFPFLFHLFSFFLNSSWCFHELLVFLPCGIYYMQSVLYPYIQVADIKPCINNRPTIKQVNVFFMYQ